MGGSNEEPSVRLCPGTIVKKWKIVRHLGEGGCGIVYEARSIEPSNHTRYAMKIEPIQENKDDEILKMEVHVLRRLQLKSDHVAELIGCGKEKHFNYMVMSMLGPNIADLRRVPPSQHFTRSTSVRIARQCLIALKDVHISGFVHRDVKPANFAIGLPQEKKERAIYIIDFGLSRSYVQLKKGKLEIREPRLDVAFRGTLRYCSLNVHLKKEQGRHDDLMSWLYMLVEMITGKLPWRNSNKGDTVKLKRDVTEAQLFMNECPAEVTSLYKYLRQLNYASNPDYHMIDENLKKWQKRKMIDNSEPFDWEVGGCYREFYEKHAKAGQDTLGSCSGLSSNDMTEDEKGFYEQMNSACNTEKDAESLD